MKTKDFPSVVAARKVVEKQAARYHQMMGTNHQMNEATKQLIIKSGLSPTEQCYDAHGYCFEATNQKLKALVENVVRQAIWIAYHSHAMNKDAKFTEHLDEVKRYYGIE
jgi:hypothetical protein